MSVTVELHYENGKKDIHNRQCFGFFKNIDFEKVDRITYFPKLSMFCKYDMAATSKYLQWLSNKTTPFMVTPITINQLIIDGISLPTKYPVQFIVGIFELYRDIVLYPQIIDYFSHLVDNHQGNGAIKDKLYYITRLVYNFADSALFINDVRKNEYLFLSREVLQNKLKNTKTTIKDASRIQGINMFFRHGELMKNVDTNLFYRNGVSTQETLSKRITNYRYNKEEVNKILEVL